jgi:hypothetical protein
VEHGPAGRGIGFPSEGTRGGELTYDELIGGRPKLLAKVKVPANAAQHKHQQEVQQEFKQGFHEAENLG